MKIAAAVIFLLFSSQVFSQENLRVDFTARGKRKKLFKINFFHGDSSVGFLFVYKIHGSRAYVFYSLYIYTEHRNNGYGEFF
ncbi:MAG: hypothetical protein NTU89_02190 [Candidatus Dependentiae bacterium]|nr:hypothetical protein [Candidatus Dependentiae bacterium]